jgi:putative heme-binding domain-containing protein
MRLALVALLAVPWSSLGAVSEDVLPTQAEWISAKAQSSGDAWFRFSFQLGSMPVKAVLLAAAAHTVEAYVNGNRAGVANGFESAITVDVTSFLRRGTNVLATRVTSASDPAAFRLMVELAFADGKQLWVVSDRFWRASSREIPDWKEVQFPDETWAFAFAHGAAGLQKWGNPFHATKTPDAYNSWMLARHADQATTPNTITVLPGFKVELLRSARADEDSWVALAFDPKGRLTIAREKRGLLRMTLAGDAIGAVEVIEDTLLECRGLLYAYDSLYVNANNSKGLYRLRDTDGDDKFDEKKLLLRTEGGVGHGRNHLTLGPDGLIYSVHGDDVVLPPDLATNSPLQQMMDDQLMPAQDPQRPPALRRYAQVGHILQTDRDGSFFRLIAGGLRNPLGVAFNQDGEMFTYDADMERDLGAPWYQPTRVLHLVPGGDYGWRRSMPNLPPYAPDVLRAVVDIGVGSPTAVAFGPSSQFPEKYRRAFFIADWAYGRVLAVHLRPEGASYSGATEPFLSGRPLNVTDLTFGRDGAMYFVTGGRGTKSGLYRVSHPRDGREEADLGRESVEPASAALRSRRRALETLPNGGRSNAAIVERIWGELGHPDRWIRYAARIALERQAIDLWQTRALGERRSPERLTALLALARVSGSDLQDPLLSRLTELLPAASSAEQLDIFRILGLRLRRHGKPAATTALVSQLEKLYPASNPAANRELCRLLTVLGATDVVAKTAVLLTKTRNTEDLLHYALFLAPLQQGWSIEHRRPFFDSLRRCEQEQGGSDYYSAIRTVRKQAVAQLTSEESRELADLLQPVQPVPSMLAALPTTLSFVREWKMEDFVDGLVPGQPDFAAGREAFHTAGCAHCHRFGNEGGVRGPDLTSVGARFGTRDLLDTILNPSKAIDEKYRSTSITLKNGEEMSGLMEREDDETVVLSGGLTGNAVMEIQKKDIVGRRLSDLSPMPGGLLNVLTRKQIIDLLAFLESSKPAAK